MHRHRSPASHRPRRRQPVSLAERMKASAQRPPQHRPHVFHRHSPNSSRTPAALTTGRKFTMPHLKAVAPRESPLDAKRSYPRIFLPSAQMHSNASHAPHPPPQPLSSLAADGRSALCLLPPCRLLYLRSKPLDKTHAPERLGKPHCLGILEWKPGPKPHLLNTLAKKGREGGTRFSARNYCPAFPSASTITSCRLSIPP